MTKEETGISGLVLGMWICERLRASRFTLHAGRPESKIPFHIQ
jgi:hypothetical protein